MLRDSNGNIVATTTTDSNGDYLFTNLPNGTYTVDVTDDNNVLNGYWHSTGPNPGANNNSQVDPYTVTVTGGQTNLTGDFGYYIEPAGLGNFVWNDTNGNGIQDGGELGIANAEVTLTITWPSGGTTTLVTTTDTNGFYSFGNLLLDEDQNGLGTYGAEPTFAISVATPTGYTTASPAGVGSNRNVDSGLATGETVTTVQGSVNNSYDFGFYTPSAVTLRELQAQALSAWEQVLAFVRQFPQPAVR